MSRLICCRFCFVTYIVSLIICAVWTPILAQESSLNLNPQSLFDTGLNMGFLTRHSQNDTGEAMYSIWASNAKAEWIDAWEPDIAPDISAQPPYPAGAFIADQNYRQVLLELPSSDCTSPWHRIKTSLYRAGFHLGTLLVETGTMCTDCLRLELQRAAIELRAVGQGTGVVGIVDLATTLDELALSLVQGMSATLFDPIVALMGELRNGGLVAVPLVPNTPVRCLDIAPPLAGLWNSTFNMINFTLDLVNNSVATGRYNSVDQGILAGTLTGHVLSGSWAEASASQRCDTPRVDAAGNATDYWGRVRFVFDSDRTQFCGFWAACDAEPDTVWNGWRGEALEPTLEGCKVILGTTIPRGVWQTSDFGRTRFETDGATVTGLYNPGQNGLITSTLIGHEIIGHWVETLSAVTCNSQRPDREGQPSSHWGRVRIAFNANFTQLCGSWEYCDEEPDRAWQGNTLGVPATTCQDGRPVE